MERRDPQTFYNVGVVHINFKTPGPHSKRSPESCLQEAVGLVQALNLDLVYQDIVTLSKKSSATLLGKGKVDSLATIVSENNIHVIIMNSALNPLQQRNLEKKWQCKVIDRTGLILEIFGKRARTAEGVLQVELASLLYQRSRLVRSWTHLERQRGGFGFTGGPGESQLELDRRLIDERIVKLKKQLTQAVRTRSLHRSYRQDIPYQTVTLVGYTNAGKSTLFNLLTQAQVFAEDLLFATLDPTMRKVKLPSGRTIILSDTVGFISDLPTQLIAAFRATLEEVCSSDVIIHVRDCSHPDSSSQAQDVLLTLEELGLKERTEQGKLITAFNKIDLLPLKEQEDFLMSSLKTTDKSVAISARTGEGCDKLLRLIDNCLNQERLLIDLTIPTTAGDLLAWLYSQGCIVNRQDKGEIIHLNLQISSSDLEKIKLRYAHLLNF